MERLLGSSSGMMFFFSVAEIYGLAMQCNAAFTLLEILQQC